ALGARPDRSTFPAQAPCPVLIVGASHDEVVPTEEQRRWAESIGAESIGAESIGTESIGTASDGAGAGGVTYVEIPETGHMLPAEKPEELAAVVADWWRLTGAALG
ncbi:alpha/beta fold hydrolase, partial [Dietzia sp. SYD-A1]|uniref:alpha/beta fold hydrolase n=1 Tax=Dietzia sp. SYD-A1 TaxID=2780141 RepID=UPI0018913C98